MAGKRYVVQGYGEIVRGEYEVGRYHDLRRAKRVARAYDGCVIDTEAADRIVWASPGYRRKVGVGQGGGTDGRTVQWRHSRNHPLGRRVAVPWLNEDTPEDETEVEEWQEDEWQQA